MPEDGQGQTDAASVALAWLNSLVSEDNPQIFVTVQNRKQAPHHSYDSQEPESK